MTAPIKLSELEEKAMDLVRLGEEHCVEDEYERSIQLLTLCTALRGLHVALSAILGKVPDRTEEIHSGWRIIQTIRQEVDCT